MLLEKKEGECPQLSSHQSCHKECRSDAGCPGDLKCCSTGCGTACVLPAATPAPAELITTHLPAYTEAPQIAGGKKFISVVTDVHIKNILLINR